MVVVLFFLVLLLLPPTALAEPVVPTPEELLAMGKAQVGERWYGIYVLGSKVGWQKDAWLEKDGLLCSDTEFILTMGFMGKTTSIGSHEVSCFSATPPLNLVTFLQEKDEDGRKVRIEGKQEETRSEDATKTTKADAWAASNEKELRFEVDAGGRKRSYTAPADSVLLLHMVPWAAVARMKPGDHVDSGTFDELTGKKRWEKITLKGTEEKALILRPVRLHRFRIQDETGVDLDALVSGEGHVLEGTLGPSIRIVLEDRETARRKDVHMLDLYSTSFVPATGELDYAMAVRVKRLKLSLTGKAAISLAENPRQKTIETGDNRVTLEVTACPARVRGAPPAGDHLKCDADIPCDLAEIKEQAEKIAAKKKGELDKARALTDWVHRRFKYTLGGGGGTGDMILQEKSGDCTEFSKGLLTLLRAVGIRSRLVSGIVPATQKPLSFGYHAWVEAWIDGRGWVALDPTWGEFPVDAAHVIFDVEQGLQMATHLGGLEMEILEVEYSKTFGEIKCE
ncbi:MAG: transglutaminase domain-containing protein [Deltaproteobacteria bacterium]|nr:transglutaminase domain-containing protein [Deltaproteobacteria bacterium]